MNLITKFLAIFSLCFFMIVLPMNTTQAAESSPSTTLPSNKDGVSAKVLVDNEKEKKVETRDANSIYIATNNKETNVITIETYDLDRNLLSTDTVGGENSSSNVNLSSSDSILPTLPNGPMMARASYTLLQKADLKETYGYWIYSYSGKEIWVVKLRTGVSKSTYYSGTNVIPFNNFKSSVDTFLANKNQMVAKVGTGIISTIVTLYLIPEPTWSKILAGLLTVVSSAIAYSEGKAMFSAYSDSKLYFGRIKE